LNTLKVLAITFAVSAVLLLSLGLYSYFWNPVGGRIVEYSYRSVSSVSYSAHPKSQWVNSGGSGRGYFFNVEYEYIFKGNSKESSFYGFYVPLSWSPHQRYQYNDKVTVYLDPVFGGISILRRGVDWLAVACLSFLLFIFYYFYRLVMNYLAGLHKK
jgi:hypothetical protein